MKHLIILCTLLATLVTARAQEQPPLLTLPTNAPTPVKEAESILAFAGQSVTNWIFTPYAIYDGGTRSFGAGIAAAYPMNQFIEPTLRLDWFDNTLWNVSGSVTLQYPMKLFGGKVTVVPFGFGGIATALGNTGEQNGRVSEVYGTGLALRIYETEKIAVGLIGDWEKFGVLEGNQYRFGPYIRFKF